MQTEIDSLSTSHAVWILGVNERGMEAGNGDMTAGRTLPWLQPASDVDVWALWQVEYRDVVILGLGNEKLDTFNLTENDLGDPVNYAALRSKLLEAAGE